MGRATNENWIFSQKGGVINITGRLKVSADDGCEFSEKCTACPLPDCQLAMTPKERKQWREKLLVEA